MSTATEPTLRCGTCSGDVALPDIIRISSRVWNCPNCMSANQWLTQPSNEGPFVTPRSFTAAPLLMDEFDKGSKKVKKAASHALMGGAPGYGKSKPAMKLFKRMKKKHLKKWIKWAKAKPYTASDLKGSIVPAVVDTSASIPTEDIRKFVDEIKEITQPGSSTPPPWMDGTALDWADAGYPDEDGDKHSPVWYLDAWRTAQIEYTTALAKPIYGLSQEDQDKHMNLLDDLLQELETYEVYVNRLFGYPAE